MRELEEVMRETQYRTYKSRGDSGNRWILIPVVGLLAFVWIYLMEHSRPDFAVAAGRTLDGPEKPEEEYTVFRPEDVELADTMRGVYEYVERVRPSRVVFDSLSEMRLLARDPLRYRRQILTLKQFFTGRKCTVLLLDDMTGTDHDLQLQSIPRTINRSSV
jgi:hypothetical protein